MSLHRTFRASIEELWAALTEPDQLRMWFAPTKIDPRVGGHIEKEAHDGGVMMAGMIRVYDPPNVFEYDWIDEHHTSIVRYELDAVGDRTQRTLVEYRLTDRSCKDRCAGWLDNIDRLDALLRGEARELDEAHYLELREAYAKRLLEI